MLEIFRMLCVNVKKREKFERRFSILHEQGSYIIIHPADRVYDYNTSSMMSPDNQAID
jgi:hypothetical protein